MKDSPIKEHILVTLSLKFNLRVTKNCSLIYSNLSKMTIKEGFTCCVILQDCKVALASVVVVIVNCVSIITRIYYPIWVIYS